MLAAFLVLLVVAGFYLLYSRGHFFLLVFSGVLLAVLFCGLTDWLTAKTGMKRWLEERSWIERDFLKSIYSVCAVE